MYTAPAKFIFQIFKDKIADGDTNNCEMEINVGISTVRALVSFSIHVQYNSHSSVRRAPAGLGKIRQ